jgi:hypothetical protein
VNVVSILKIPAIMISLRQEKKEIRKIDFNNGFCILQELDKFRKELEEAQMEIQR